MKVSYFIKKEIIQSTALILVIFFIVFTLIGGWSSIGNGRFTDVATAAIVASTLSVLWSIAHEGFAINLSAVTAIGVACAAYLASIGPVPAGPPPAAAFTAFGLLAAIIMAVKFNHALKKYRGESVISVALAYTAQYLVIFGAMTLVAFL